MSETLFNQFADEGALIAQREFFLKEILAPIKEGIKSTNTKIATIDSSPSKRNVDELSRGVDILEKNLRRSREQMAEINNTLRLFTTQMGNATKAQKEAAQAALLEAKAANESAKAKKSQAQSSRDAEKAQKSEAKAAEDAANDYLQLSRAYNESALKAKNYALRLGENHPVTVQAIKDANDIGNTLKRLDAAVGQHQRNVGNYAGAVQGLGFSFTQVARELPSLAVNFQQFALAISNNLPFVADNIAKAKNELALLRAEGKQAPSLFSLITKSIFSFGVGLSVAITLFTVYAKQIGEFVSNLFKVSEGIDKARDSQKILNEVYKEGNSEYEQAIQNVSELKTEIGLAKQGFIDKDAVVKRYNETIGQTTGEVKTLDEAEQALNKNAESYIRFTLLKAAANLALGKAAKEVVKQAEDQQSFNEDLVLATKDKPKRSTTEFITTDAGEAAEEGREAEKRVIAERDKAREISQKRIKNFEDIAQEFLTQASLISSQFKFSFFGGSGDSAKEFNKFFSAQLEFQRDQFLKVGDDEDRFIAERIKARKIAASIDEQIIRGKAQVEIENAKGNAKEIAFIQKTTAVELKKINLERDEAIIELQNNFYQKLINNVSENERILKEAKKGLFDDQSKEAKDSFDRDKLAVEKFYDQQLQIIVSNFKRGKITQDQYNAERKANDKDLKKSLIEAELIYTEELLKLRKLQGLDVDEQEKKIFDLKKQLRDSDIKDYEDYQNKLFEINKKITEDIKKAAEQLVDQLKESYFTVIGGLYDAQINKIRDQIDIVNELKAAEIERVNSSTANAEEKAARIKIIESQAQNDREALERRQRNLERQRALIERAQSAFSITIAGIRDVARIKSSAAAAYANAMATVPPPFNVIAANFASLNTLKQIPFSIATTAAALAGLLATPIPKFYKGTPFSPEGIAEVAERGPELAIDQKGNAKVYEKRTLAYLSKGTKIYPADATKDILNAANDEKSSLLRAFSNNVTISYPDHGDKIDKQTKILERIESKSRIAIINNTPIETSAWYQKHFKS